MILLAVLLVVLLLPSSTASAASTVAARQQVFGKENVDPQTGAVRRDRAILSWFGVTNFAMAIRGHVVLLDAWVPRGLHANYVPTTPAQLAALEPEAIFIGHAHFDHAADAVPIALASGAALIGTAEHCDAFRARAATVRCIDAIPRGMDPATVRSVDILGDDVTITAVKHVHSETEAPDTGDPHLPALPPPDPRTPLFNPPTFEGALDTLRHLPDAEGGTVLYQFRAPGLALTWHDSSGPLPEEAPGVFDALRRLPGTDVHLGAIQSFNQFLNGFRDARLYIETLRPKLFVPTHMDDWAPGVTTKAEHYEAGFREEIARIPADRRPEVRFIYDPFDYINPRELTFPLSLPEPRLTRRCAGRRLRAAIADAGEVGAVTFRLGARAVRDTSGPFTFETAGRTRASRIRAAVELRGGGRRALSRPTPRCR